MNEEENMKEDIKITRNKLLKKYLSDLSGKSKAEKETKVVDYHIWPRIRKHIRFSPAISGNG